MSKYLVTENTIKPLDGESVEDFLISDDVFFQLSKDKDLRIAFLKEFEKSSLIVERLGVKINTPTGEDLYIKSVNECNIDIDKELLKLYRGKSHE